MPSGGKNYSKLFFLFLSRKKIIKTIIHNNAAYRKYHETSWIEDNFGGENIASEPVEIICINCANKILPVLV